MRDRRFPTLFLHARICPVEWDNHQRPAIFAYAEIGLGIEEIERVLQRDLPVPALPGGKGIFGTADIFALIHRLQETGLDQFAAVERTGNEIVRGRAVFAPDEADRLQASRPEAEFIVAAEFGVPFVPAESEAPAAFRSGHGVGLRDFLLVALENADLAVEIRHHAARRFPRQRSGHGGIVGNPGIVLVAALDPGAIAVGNGLPAGIGTAFRQAVRLKAPAQPFAAARQGERAFVIIGRQVFPCPRLPAPGAGNTALPVRDDVRHLAGKARNIQGRTIDQVNPRHLAGRNPPERSLCPVRFARHPLPVDQHIAIGLPEAARAVIVVLNGKARNARDHVERGARIVLGEVCRGETRPGGHRLGGVRLGHGRQGDQADRRQGGESRQKGTADSHGAPPPASMRRETGAPASRSLFFVIRY